MVRLVFNAHILREKVKVLLGAVKDRKEIANRSVMISRHPSREGMCLLNVNNGECCIQYTVPVSVEEGQWDRKLVVELKALSNVLKCAGPFVEFSDTGKSLKTILYNGTVEVETYGVSPDVMDLGFLLSKHEGIPFQVDQLFEFVDIVSEALCFSMGKDDKTAWISNGIGAYCSMVSVVVVKNASLPNLCVAHSYLSFLKNMLRGNAEARIVERKCDYLIRLPDMLFTVPRCSTGNIPKIVEAANAIRRIGEVEVSAKDLSNILDLIWSMSGNNSKCRFISEDGVLRLVSESAMGRNMKFDLAPCTCATNLSFLCPTLGVFGLSKLLSFVDSGKISVSEDGLTLFDSDRLSVVVGNLR